MLEFRLISSYTHFELLAAKMSAVVFAPDSGSLAHGYSQIFRNYHSYGRISYAFNLGSLRKMLWNTQNRLPQLVVMEVNKDTAGRKLQEIAFGLMAIGARELGQQPLKISGVMHREAEMPVVLVVDMPTKMCEDYITYTVPSNRLMPGTVVIVEKNKFFNQGYSGLPGTDILNILATLYQKKHNLPAAGISRNFVQ